MRSSNDASCLHRDEMDIVADAIFKKSIKWQFPCNTEIGVIFYFRHDRSRLVFRSNEVYGVE